MDNTSTREDMIRIINDYNDNTRQYNRNVRDFINIYNRLSENRRNYENPIYNRNHTNTRNHNHNHNRRYNYNNLLFSNYPNLYIPDELEDPIIDTSNDNINNNYINTFISNYNNSIRNTVPERTYITTLRNRTIRPPILTDYFEDNVIVRPTNNEITRATQPITWSNDFSQTTCPITLERFEVGQVVTQIHYCQHIFQTDSLMNWFERNTRCPVCRYDIREYTDGDNIHDFINENSNENREINQQNTISEREDHLINTNQNNNSINNNIINNNIINNENIDDNPFYNIDQSDISGTILYEPATNRRTFFTSILSNLITSELNRSVPIFNDFMNDQLYTFNIPLEIDLSYINLTRRI